MIYFILAIVAYFFLARFVIVNYDEWEEADTHGEVPPLVLCLFFAIIGAMAWPLSLGLVIPISIYYKKRKDKKRKGK